MTEISINEVRDLQIAILKNVVCFCETNNIRYFLAFGTLLGAIRHKGYIPWDDDIDICMPRPDYERFRILYKADIYEFVDIHNTPNFGLASGKVCDKRTVVKMEMFQTCGYGAYIDVFPIDAIGDNFQLLKSRILLHMLRIKKAKLKTGRSFIKDLSIWFCKFLLTPFSLRKLVLTIDNMSKQNQYESRNIITCFSDEDWLKIRLPRNMFEEFVYAEFEGGQYRIPKDYTFYLEKMYGNFMELPPIEKRVSQHNMKVYWK